MKKTLLLLLTITLLTACEEEKKYRYPKPDRYYKNLEKKASDNKNDKDQSLEKSPDEIAGALLFRNYCAQCHNKSLKSPATGPALLHITDDREMEWLRAWTRNSQKMIADGDEIAIQNWNEYKPTVMTAFPDLTDEELDQLYSWINYESNRIDPVKRIKINRA